MTLDKISQLTIKPIKVKEDDLMPTFRVNGLPKPYFRSMFCGCSGCGKTSSYLSWFKQMKPDLFKTFVVSPTIYQDPKQKQMFMDEDIEVYEEPNVEALVDIYSQVKKIFKDYKDSKNIVKAFKALKDVDYDVDKLNPTDLVRLYQIDFDPSKIKYQHNHKPNMLLILDDVIESPLVKSPQFNNLMCRLRHYGVNSIVNLQSFKGVSPVVRRQQTIFCIFKTPDTNMLKQIYEECGIHFDDYDHFLRCYNHCIKDSKHNFMYVDMNDEDRPVRKCFDTPIDVKQFKE